MKESKNKVIIYYTTLGIIALGIVILTITYAYWRLTKEQTKHNEISTGCFDIDFVGENDILLEKAYPISDLDGKSLDPYTFTITNHCEAKADYTINLEMLSGTNLASDYVKILLNEEGVEGTPNLLNYYDNYDSDEEYKVANAIEGRKLLTGTLEALDVKKYELRIWLGSNATIENDTMNKTYKSKIVVDTSFKEVKENTPTIELGKDVIPVENGDGLYVVTHESFEELGPEWNKAEYRYAGVNPDNYVKFNNEIWRIIGLVNVKTETGVEQRLKIVRTDGIAGQKDFGLFANNSSDGGNNDWTTNKLKDMLNGIYYESKTGECHRGLNTDTTETKKATCDFNSGTNLPKGLDETARSMVDKEVIWNIGGSDESDNVTVKMFYERERGTSSGNSNKAPSEWSNETDVGGKHNGIGLIYPSDYGFATNGGSIGRETCFAGYLHDWSRTVNDINYLSECARKDWLRTKYINYEILSITPDPDASDTMYIVLNEGSVYSGSESYWASGIWPVVYLTDSTKIINGNGTIEEPFELSVQ